MRAGPLTSAHGKKKNGGKKIKLSCEHIRCLGFKRGCVKLGSNKLTDNVADYMYCAQINKEKRLIVTAAVVEIIGSPSVYTPPRP